MNSICAFLSFISTPTSIIDVLSPHISLCSHNRNTSHSLTIIFSFAHNSGRSSSLSSFSNAAINVSISGISMNSISNHWMKSHNQSVSISLYLELYSNIFSLASCSVSALIYTTGILSSSNMCHSAANVSSANNLWCQSNI